MLQKDSAVCLRRLDYSETSQVVTLFARQTGKLDAIAKGSKRPKSSFDGTIELFSYGDIVFSQRKSDALTTLTEFVQKPLFFHSQADLLTLNCSLFAAELIESFTADFDPHPELFDAFVEFLKNIQNTAGKPQKLAFLILFQLTLLAETGTMPLLSECANCSRNFREGWPEIYFSSSANGLICNDCEQAFPDKMKMSQVCGQSLADLKLINKAGKKVLNQIEKILIYHFTELMHRTPKMAKSFLSPP
jgi:DNA repair protein RecO (recombination protein O)